MNNSEEQPEKPGAAAEASRDAAGSEMTDLQQQLEATRSELQTARQSASNASKEASRARQEAQQTREESAEAVKQSAKVAMEAATFVQSLTDQAVDLAKRAEEQADVAAGSAAAWSAEDAKVSDQENRKGFFYGVTFAVVVAGLVFYFFLIGPSKTLRNIDDSGSLRVFAHAESQGDPTGRSASNGQLKWKISGTVVSSEKLENTVEILVILTDALGNRFSAVTAIPPGTTEPGDERPGNEKPAEENSIAGGSLANLEFETSIVQVFADRSRVPVREISVTATSERKGWLDSTDRGSTIIQPDQGRRARWTKASGEPFMASLILFGVGFLVCLWHTRDKVFVRANYYAIVVLALAFTVAMIVFISTTTQELAGSQNKEEVISLGFAHVYFGTYVADEDPEWLLSMTAPNLGDEDRKVGDAQIESRSPPQQGEGSGQAGPPAASIVPGDAEQTPDNATGRDAGDQADSPTGAVASNGVVYSKGFGAPLWLILLAVVGSSVFMIRLLVDSLKTPVTFSPDLVRARMAEIVRYEVYILFAPLGAILVYQLLVSAGSASEPITVGLAALAAGIGLNNLLEKAWKGTESVTKS